MKVRIGPSVVSPLLTHAEAAKLLGTSAWAVGDQVRRGRFPVPDALLTTGTPVRTRISAVALAAGMGWPYELVSADDRAVAGAR